MSLLFHTSNSQLEKAVLTAPAEEPSRSVTTVAAPSTQSYPPQSAALPVMPSPLTPQSGVASVSVGSPSCEPAFEEQRDSADIASIDDAVITGRKGSPSGTIAVLSGQETVPWPKLSGAPPGYPGIASYAYSST